MASRASVAAAAVPSIVPSRAAATGILDFALTYAPRRLGASCVRSTLRRRSKPVQKQLRSRVPVGAAPTAMSRSRRNAPPRNFAMLVAAVTRIGREDAVDEESRRADLGTQARSNAASPTRSFCDPCQKCNAKLSEPERLYSIQSFNFVMMIS